MSQIRKFTVWFFKSTVVPSQTFTLFNFRQTAIDDGNEHASNGLLTIESLNVLIGKKLGGKWRVSDEVGLK
ncbi:MAG TPA: hypothetical protein VIG25_04875 [Pyrinomonadaceae bacterium]|jgi:hypothetical protein